MICRLTGRLDAVGAESVVIEVGGLAYEVLVPAATLAELQELVGRDITLHTLHYFEGSPAGAHLVPRLIGFRSVTDRNFYTMFTRLRGISHRRALRAMTLPVPQLAAAIENGDVRLLSSLPEIGKKTAAQIVAELRGQLEPFVGTVTPVPQVDLTDAQRVAVDILVRWGDRRADAERWVAAAVAAEPGLTEPQAIVRAAYRVKQQG